MTAPRLLAIDTSTESMALALHDGTTLHALDGAGGAQASALLLPQLRALLDGAGLAFADLDAIAFGRGPGAFTGLRTACAVAQGLAFGLGRPVLALDSLQIVAEDARVQAGGDAPFDVLVANDARMGEAYVAAYRWDGARWTTTLEPALCAPDALASLRRELKPGHLAGSALDVFGDALPPGAERRWPRVAGRAAAAMALARQAWAAGAALDPAQALPLYLRDKVAQTTAERAARAAAAG